jgi:hypothetical protein
MLQIQFVQPPDGQPVPAQEALEELALFSQIADPREPKEVVFAITQVLGTAKQASIVLAQKFSELTGEEVDPVALDFRGRYDKELNEHREETEAAMRIIDTVAFVSSKMGFSNPDPALIQQVTVDEEKTSSFGQAFRLLKMAATERTDRLLEKAGWEITDAEAETAKVDPVMSWMTESPLIDDTDEAKRFFWIAKQLQSVEAITVISKIKAFGYTIDTVAAIAEKLVISARQYLDQKPKILENVAADFQSFSHERRGIKEAAVLTASIKNHFIP